MHENTFDEGGISSPSRQFEDSLLTHRMSDINDINRHHEILIKKKQPSSCNQFYNRIRKALGLKQNNSLDYYLEQESTKASQALFSRKMQLIADPVYMESLPKPSQTMEQFVLKYTSIIKIVPPQAFWMSIWHIVICIVIFYYFFEIGLLIFIGQKVWNDELQNWWSYLFNIFAFGILIMDILVSLNKGYYRSGILIMDRKSIYKHYLRRYAVIDITGLVIIMACFFSRSFVLNYFKILFLLKLDNLNLIDVTFQRVLQFNRTRSTIYQVGRLILLMIMSCHYLGGAFYAIDFYVYSTNYYGPNTPNWCWIYNAQAYGQMVLNLPWWLQYEYWMYWSLATMTTIAYGDITPLNPLETFYVIFMLIISCIMFAYILNNIIEILLEAKASMSNFERELVTMNQFMSEKLITQKLKTKIRAYFQMIWNEERYRDKEVEQEMIGKLPQQLQNQLLTNVYKKFIVELLFDRYFSEDIISSVCGLISEYRTSHNEIIFEGGTLLDPKAYFLLKGKIVFYLTDTVILDEMQYGAFGICEFYTQRPRYLSAKSIYDALLYMLPWDKFIQVVRADAEANETWRYAVDQMMEKEAEMLGILCFICNSSTHLCKSCPSSHFVLPMYMAVKRQRNMKQKRYGKMQRKRQRKYENLLKSIKQVRKEHLKFEEITYREDMSRMDTIQTISNELGISETFNNIEEYIAQTQLLLKYMRDKILHDSDYLEDTMIVDTRKDFDRYYPDYNFPVVIDKFGKRSKLSRF